jgi:LDH2 family malate/lactate/ureidoglycolate dehydrogenase
VTGEEKLGPDIILAQYEELFGLGLEALKIVGVPPQDARIVVDVLLRADLRGVGSHGIQRLLMYVPRLRKGLINPTPKAIVESPGPGLKIVYGDNGLGPVVASRGMREAISLAKEPGIGFVGCRNSNHFGAAAPYVLMACEEKMIGIAATNAFPTMAPWGGLKNLVGNNPLAIGVPCGEGFPFVLDIAMSVSSRGRMREMASRKEMIPEGWALDAQGRPTTDPLEGLKGFVLPIGQHKGSGLAVAVDILSGVLTGAGFSTGVKSVLQEWDEPQNVGHFFIVIDPRRFMPWEAFSDRMRQLFECLRGAPRIDPGKPIFVPGEIEAQMEKVRKVDGIPVELRLFGALKGLAEGNYDYQIPSF